MKQVLIAISLLLVLAVSGRAQDGFSYLQERYPGVIAECQVPRRVSPTAERVTFQCVERSPVGHYSLFYHEVLSKEMPAEWPATHALFTRRFLYLAREEGELKALRTEPEPCDPGFGPFGGAGQPNTSACHDGYLFPAWERQERNALPPKR